MQLLLAMAMLFGQIFSQIFSPFINLSNAEIDQLKIRSTGGPYRTLGDAGAPFTPADYTRILTFANQFRAAPVVPGNTNAEALTVWTGPLDGVIGTASSEASWQHKKGTCAGLVYLITADSTYAVAVRRAVMAQVRLEATIPLSCVGNWPANSPYEPGYPESQMLDAMLNEFDFCKDRFSPSQKDSVNRYLSKSAYYFAGQIHNQLAKSFPDRLKNNYKTGKYLADPKGVAAFNPYPIFSPPTKPIHLIWLPNTFIYTHSNPDGSLGNIVPRLGVSYNNRTGTKMSFIGRYGVFSGDTTLIWHRKQYSREWLKYSMFPDGTLCEYERGGEYEEPSQGMHYNSINLQSEILFADALARRGDYSQYTYATTEGLHGTQCSFGQEPKSLLTAITRYADHCTGERPIYYGLGETRKLISNIAANGKMTPWDYVFAVANKWYKSDKLKCTYLHTRAGSNPYPATGYTTAAKVYVPWMGTGAEMPGVLFMYANLENIEVYNRSPSAGIASVLNVLRGPKYLVLDALPQGPNTITAVSWRQVAGTPIRVNPLDRAHTTIYPIGVGAELSIGTYAFRVLVKDAAGNRAEKLVTVNVNP